MRDELIELLRDRFSGHELEVPDGVWEHVSGQLAASASAEGLRQTLQGKFQAHEVEVDPSAWSNISAQLRHGAAAGSPFSTAWVAAGFMAVAITASIILWNTHEVQAPANIPPVEAAPPTHAPVTPPASKAEAEVASIATPVQVDQVPAQATTDALKRSASVSSPVPLRQTPAAMDTTATNAAPPVAQIAMDGSEPATPVTAALPSDAPSTDVPGPVAVKAEGQTPMATTASEGTTETPHPGQSSAVPSSAPSSASSEAADPFPLFIPNVLTPNGDGVNDKLVITAGEHHGAWVRIFSMDGSLVFETSDLYREWNGLLPNGNIAPEGFYNCIVRITDLDGKSHLKKEVVRLYR